MRPRPVIGNAICLVASALAAASAQELPRANWGIQSTVITQTAPSFQSPYEGPNSLKSEGSDHPATTLTVTVYGALRLWKGAWICVAPEFSGGDGLGGGAGAGAYPNLEIVRVSSLRAKPYVARAFLQQIFALGHPSGRETETFGKNPEESFSPGTDRSIAVASQDPRLVVTAGKISLPDVFDTNDFVGDGRHGLMNWALANNGAWDYAADTRGYTWGATVAYEGGPVAVRFGSHAMPSTPNGPNFDHDLRRAYGENLEVEWPFDPDNAGVVRLLAYVNHARMGDYEEALQLAGPQPADLAPTRAPGRRKWGLGLSAQRRIGEKWGAWLRLGWNDGKTESFAYTEIDRTVSAGVTREGDLWGRPQDRLFLAVVASALSGSHRRYLEAGGSGFQLGDGRLSYANEVVAELDYLAPLTRSVSVSLDYQYLRNPGYNSDRGPISVLGVRLHVHR